MWIRPEALGEDLDGLLAGDQRALTSPFVDGKVIAGDFDIPNLQAGNFKIPAGRDGKGAAFSQGVASVVTARFGRAAGGHHRSVVSVRELEIDDEICQWVNQIFAVRPGLVNNPFAIDIRNDIWIPVGQVGL